MLEGEERSQRILEGEKGTQTLTAGARKFCGPCPQVPWETSNPGRGAQRQGHQTCCFASFPGTADEDCIFALARAWLEVRSGKRWRIWLLSNLGVNFTRQQRKALAETFLSTCTVIPPNLLQRQNWPCFSWCTSCFSEIILLPKLECVLQ